MRLKIICLFVNYSLIAATKLNVSKSAVTAMGFIVKDKHFINGLWVVSEKYAANHFRKIFPDRRWSPNGPKIDTFNKISARALTLSNFVNLF